ncbi:MAG: DUF378 domain-containing protein [Candidatus Peribacteraceae bacterium]|jgi:uncharacterized membrane protein YuzA (DUF378 family)|nr:DUF378 domain-containing protein [Candidatus Peribacteraceae bacterium]MDP7454666.1 DUF378 domain-containing protein [Candidatus Peribacteraceae bacterium]MDP7646316.1 DUF378 domain-containing protein [Candidatus Peribacteraceae bacterium]|tara:strand:- start:360 stop:560 length:201 start_codon:yes stop_codon:yes gene_type:complete
MKGLGPIARILLLVGGLNMGLVGVGMLVSNDLNVINMVVGGLPVLEAVVYVLVGLSALFVIFNKKA